MTLRTGKAIGQGLPGPASEWRFHGQHDPTRRDDVCDAAAQGDLKFLGAMVRHGLDIDIADDKGRTTLMCAQNGEVADFLLRQGADPNAADRDGYTVLHYHLWSDAALSLVPVLLEHGVAPQRSSSPLLRELAVRFIEWRRYHEGEILLEMLVAAGWDVDERDRHGATLLHVAAHNDNLPLAESVLRLGADPSLRDREGQTAAAIAQELGSSRVLSRLLEAQEREQP
ncbi:ankyrin repeat domain-containing protein [Thioalkalivibrio nitratireducens]|uniref:ankyrin repeat domain-containing protein n=1 Tax=Thioalkalivibrio nitratireducens TaxID=186931 RepID=UPI00146FD9F0|nr:ankyrin repeat domain-containing protein [Thioalkalivibrio nitratireducens]